MIYQNQLSKRLALLALVSIFTLCSLMGSKTMAATVLQPVVPEEIQTTQPEQTPASTDSGEDTLITPRGIYLSDLDYLADYTSIAHGSYGKDVNTSGNPIRLRVDDAVVTFGKGIGAHARSSVTFDISQYSEEFTRFVGKLGIDYSMGTKGGLFFVILASNTLTDTDTNEGWDVLLTTPVVSAADNAIEVDVNVSGYRYLRLYADPNGSNGHDHAVYADARLVRTDYVDPETNVATERGVYLSDLNYTAIGTHIGYGSYHKDTSVSGSTIQLRVNGTVVPFEKGIGAHASSAITFNIGKYSDEFTRFSAKLGIDASQGNKGNVWFRISVSDTLTAWNDQTGWIEVVPQTYAVTAGSNAIDVDVDVGGYQYIRLYVDTNGGNGNDHAAFADARLIRDDYDTESEYFPDLHGLDWYDSQLSQHDALYNLENNMGLLLQREFVSRIGLMNIQNAVRDSETMGAALRWLIYDSDALQLFIEGGNIKNPALTLQTLDTLYSEFSHLLSTADGYVYKKMILGLTLTFANDQMMTPYSFGAAVGKYDVVERFRAVLWIYDNDKLYYGREMFASYNMELMRAVMGDYVGTDELQWIQHYARKKYPNNPEYWTGPYRFMSYVHPPLYNRPEYFAEDTWQGYDEKYDLTEYNLLNSGSDQRVFRLWMVYEAGGICWNISRTGQTLNRSYGIPSIGTFQPGHEAYFTYSENADGQGMWSIGNNVGGWQSAYSYWSGAIHCRYLLNWGTGTVYSKTTRNNGSYMLLAQGALNRYADFQDSLYLNLLADVYDTPEEKLAVYQASLDALELNLDSYVDIMGIYISQADQITQEQWYALAMQIIDAYTYYPVPMVDLLNAIEPYLGNYAAQVNTAKINALKKAQSATEAESIQWGAVIPLATSMLGQNVDDVLATFSFDGENGGCLVIGAGYDQYAFQVKYSLDGGENWYEYNKDAEGERIIRLSDEQLAMLHEDTDILMYLAGQDVSQGDYHVIDLQIRDGLNTARFQVEDRENHLEVSAASVLQELEYSTDAGQTWQDYVPSETRFPGDVTVQLRYKSKGLYKAGPVTEYTFTENVEEDTFHYISVRELDFVSAGTHQGGTPPQNMVDANSFTEWHSKWGVVETDKSFVIAFQDVKRFAGFRYLPGGGINGRFATGLVYTSIDGETWTQVGSFTWGSSTAEKECRLEESVTAKYVKIEAVNTYTNGNEPANMYVSGKNFSFYEDTTREPDFVVTVGYSTYALTNQDVVATLVVTGGESQSYTFTENGTHAFTYLDINGEPQIIEAQVTWIDKTPPTGTVVYEPEAPTNGMVYAFIIPDEQNVTVLNGTRDSTGEETGEGSGDVYHVFDSNGTYEFQLQDEAGNIGYVTAEVTWIDTQAPTAVIHYDISPDRMGIIASVVEPSEYVIFGADQGSYEFRANGDYEFVFHDLAGNETRLTAHVTAFDENGNLNFAENTDSSDAWIEYSIMVPTNQDVTATLVLADGCALLGERTQYTFRSNGEYPFVYQNTLGQICVANAVVTWIDKTPPTATVLYSTTAPTNGNVTVTLGGLVEDVTILHPTNGSDTIILTDNGSSYFEFSDALGNVAILPVNVTWIDRESPTGRVEYARIGDTVVAHVVDLSEEVVFGEDSGTYTFTENGSYTFVFHDLAGNETRLEATVDSISEVWDITVEGSAMLAGASIHAPEGGWKSGENTFTVSCDLACYVAVSRDGGQTYTRLSGTQVEGGYAFTVEDLDPETRLAVVLNGDTNGDGTITAADCSRLTAYTLKKIQLDPLALLAADTNGDGTITAADCSRLTAYTLKKIQLSW